MEIPAENTTQTDINEIVRRLDERLARIESHLGLPPLAGVEPVADQLPPANPEEREEELELRIGQNWFAKAGIVVLAIGIAFLLTFPYQNIPSALPSLFGVLLVGAIFFLSYSWRETYDQVSRYLLGGGLLLLYLAVLRLAYFSPTPAIDSPLIEMPLLLVVVSFSLVVAARRGSVYLACLGLTMGFLAALLGEHPVYVFAVLTLLSLVTAYFRVRFHWTSVLAYGTILTYLTHLLWAMNNPVVGNRIQMVGEPAVNLLFILIYATVFASATLLRGRDEPESLSILAMGVVSGGGSFGLFLLLTLVSFQTGVAFWHLGAAVVFLILAVLFWRREHSRYSTFVYAMLGYVALSVSIMNAFPVPDFFVWLCWESVLVLATAVSFRSRFIVVANFMIYLVVFIAYLFTAGTVNIVSISFGVAALLSARILNWKRDRLELKTEMMRNAYLGSALLFVPYALYQTMPRGFVSLSWLGVALFYYIASRLLRNRKYRWMALLTTLMTIVYVFIVDFVGLDPTLRIVSFLVLGSVLLLISMIYTRRKSRTQAEKKSEPGLPTTP